MTFDSAARAWCGCDCISCGEEMRGIYSYEIREICSPCGGKAKDDSSVALAQRRRMRYAEAKGASAV